MRPRTQSLPCDTAACGRDCEKRNGSSVDTVPGAWPRWRRAASGPSNGLPREVTQCPIRLLFCRSSPQRCPPRSWRLRPTWPLTGANPHPVRLPAQAVVRLVPLQRVGPADGDPTRPRRAGHPPDGRATADGLLVNTMMHAVRGYFRFAHIDGLIGSDPAVDARLPKIHRDESRTQGLDRLEFDQVPAGRPNHRPPRRPRPPVGITAVRASEAAAARIADYADTLRACACTALVDKGNKPATMPMTAHGAARLGGLPGPTDEQTVGASPGLWRADRPARRPDPGPARRPLHHRALRPRPRQSRRTRRPLPDRIRRRRLTGPGHPRRLLPLGRTTPPRSPALASTRRVR